MALLVGQVSNLTESPGQVGNLTYQSRVFEAHHVCAVRLDDSAHLQDGTPRCPLAAMMAEAEKTVGESATVSIFPYGGLTYALRGQS